jgi:hypothetical protein
MSSGGHGGGKCSHPPCTASGANQTISRVLLPALSQGAAEGKVPSSVASCLLALDASSLTDVVESVLADNLTQAELQAADTFFGTTAGKKYAKLGSLGVYKSVDETPPEDSPSISDAEYKGIEDFKSTAVSSKLWKVLDGESAQRVFGARLRALANSCGAGWR